MGARVKWGQTPVPLGLVAGRGTGKKGCSSMNPESLCEEGIGGRQQGQGGCFTEHQFLAEGLQNVNKSLRMMRLVPHL